DPAPADPVVPAGARRGRGAPAPDRRRRTPLRDGPAGVGDLPARLAGGVRAGRQGAGRLRADRGTGAVGSAAARAQVPLPPARHRGARPGRAGAGPGLHGPGALRGVLPRVGVHPVRAGPGGRVAAAARLLLRRWRTAGTTPGTV
ncbi:MAG: 2H phosphoesterase superfamily protein Bsu1186 (yjcG), partial [uncultured Frankineae bacterium]